MHRKFSLVIAVLICAVALAGCPKDPYRAAIQGSKDVSDGVAAAIKITASYYTSNAIDDTQKAKVAGVLSVITDCNTKFRMSVVGVHNSGQTSIQAFLPIADSFVQCAQSQRAVMSDPKIFNILQAVDTAINGVSLAVASAKGAN